MKKTSRRRMGDRRDGVLIRNTDSMHAIMPLIFPNRCDNEAFISEKIDLTNINKWLLEKTKTILNFHTPFSRLLSQPCLKQLYSDLK